MIEGGGDGERGSGVPLSRCWTDSTLTRRVNDSTPLLTPAMERVQMDGNNQINNKIRRKVKSEGGKGFRRELKGTRVQLTNSHPGNERRELRACN